MSSITTWSRIESRARSESFNSLQARIHDPLWMLTRQWQLGEFQGEDAGTPIFSQLSMRTTKIDKCSSGEETLQSDSIDSTPLETIIEREPPILTLRDRIEAGLYFIRTILPAVKSEIQDAHRKFQHDLAKDEKFKLNNESLQSVDADSKRYFNVMRDRAIDGTKLYKELEPIQDEQWYSKEPFNKYLIQDEQTKAIFSSWINWYKDRYLSTSQQHWINERLAYSATLLQEKQEVNTTLLEAKEYHGGHLDWHAFDVITPENLVKADTISIKAIPAPVRYRGMAAFRFWEFEDGAVDFGGIEAAPEDLLRMILVDFALVYGNDFFCIPVKLKLGTLCWQHELSVRDTFGIETRIRPISNGKQPWRLFELSSKNGTDAPGIFFLAPTLVQSLESRPVEVVKFIRDEMLNIAWAIERTVEGANGHPVSRSEIENLDKPEEAAPTETELRYRLITGTPPSYWYPMLPQKQSETSVENRLELLSADKNEPIGRILSTMTSVFDEEVPRTGTQINCTYQYARWIDGSTHLWLGRKRRPGRGEGSSGLRFDVAENR